MKYIIALAIITAALAIMVWNGIQSPSCEALYNEYSSTVDMSQRDAIFSRGIETGCFHYN